MNVKLPIRTLTTVCLSAMILIGMMLAMSGCVRSASAVTSTESEVSAADPSADARAETTAHEPYIQGSAGFFHPDRPVTRAQTAQLLFNLGFSQPGTASFADVEETEWYAPAIAQLSDLFSGYEDGTFRPNGGTTMAEFVTILCRAMDLEEEALTREAGPGEPWYTPYWTLAAEYQWFPEDFSLRGDMPMTRAMAVAVLNRALDRVPDTDWLDNVEQVLFVDVRPDHWAYYDILEATIAHQCGEDGSWLPESVSLTPLESGVYVSGGVGYYVEPSGTLYRTPGILQLGGDAYLVADETGRIWADNAIHPYGNTLVCCAGNGKLLRNNSFHGFYFDDQGFYTSRNAEVDGYVAEILAACTDESMTQLEKLRAVFDYVRNYGYLGRNPSIADAVMSQEQAASYACKIFETGKGDCYNFTAAFYWLARGLGYDATAVVGTCRYTWGTRAISHAWVEIPMDGTVYLFDPQIENYNLRSGISNTAYGAFQVTYQTAHATYYPN